MSYLVLTFVYVIMFFYFFLLAVRGYGQVMDIEELGHLTKEGAWIKKKYILKQYFLRIIFLTISFLIVILTS